MKLLNQRKSLTVIAVLSVYISGLQLIFQAVANAAPLNSRNQLILAQKSGICSFINGNNVNIRSGPGTQYKTVLKLNRGDTVRAVRKSGNWVQLSGRVTSAPGVTPEVVKPLNGWVLNTYINGCSEDQFERWRQ